MNDIGLIIIYIALNEKNIDILAGMYTICKEYMNYIDGNMMKLDNTRNPFWATVASYDARNLYGSLFNMTIYAIKRNSF